MHKDYRFTFVAKDEQLQKTILFLRADEKNSMDLWIRTLSAASKSDANPLSREKQLSQSYELLELNPSDPHTLQQVNKAYRRLCLKHHPDKGYLFFESMRITSVLPSVVAITTNATQQADPRQCSPPSSPHTSSWRQS